MHLHLTKKKASLTCSLVLKHYPAQMQKVKVYRYNPELGEKPKMVEYNIDLAECGPMILDAVLKIKDEIDSTLALRR